MPRGELGTGETQHEDRLAHTLGDVGEEVHERLLRPLQVVDHQNVRPSAGVDLEQAPRCPGDLVRRRRALGEADHLREHGARATSVAPPREDCVDPLERVEGLVPFVDSRDLPDELAEGEVRDVFAVRETANRKDLHRSAGTIERCLDEPRLADAGVAEHEQARRRIG